MTVGSGLAAQLGIAEESTFGTYVAPTRFLEFNSESLMLAPKRVVSDGLRGQAFYARSSNRVTTSKQVGGDLELDVASVKFGLIFKHMLGTPSATASQIGVTPLYRQIHTPGDYAGRSLSIQVGKPQSDGTVRSHSYLGCKLASWELACAIDQLLTLKATIDGRTEDAAQSLGTASYVTTSREYFHWGQAAVTIGGTVSTSSGLATISGGAALKSCRGISVKHTAAMADGRIFAGNGGLKSEQLLNGRMSTTMDLDLEYADKTQVYDLFAADTGTPIEIVFTGTTDVGSANFAKVKILFSAAKFDAGAPTVGGPDIVDNKATMVAMDDSTNAPVQIVYESIDTSV